MRNWGRGKRPRARIRNGGERKFAVHLGDKAAELGRGLGRQPVDLIPQTLLADGAGPVHGNFRFPARALDLQPATPLRMQRGGERTDDDHIEKLIHLILTDYTHRTHFADFSPQPIDHRIPRCGSSASMLAAFFKMSRWRRR